MLKDIVVTVNWAILIYLVLFSFGYLLLLLASIRDVKLRFQEVYIADELDVMKSKSMPAVTVLIPVYNDERFILDSVYSALKSDYSHLNVIVINDGSTDKTMEKLINEFKFKKTEAIVHDVIKSSSEVRGYYISSTHSNLVLIDKTHVDRGDALNVGINATVSPLFITLDADSLLEPNAISEMVFYMMTKPHAVAVGGSVYILNGCKYQQGEISSAKIPYRFITGYQCLEYMRSFLFNRSGWNFFRGALCYSGTATLFEREAVIKIGGFELNNTANDFEIITSLHAHQSRKTNPYQMGFTPAATVWTDVPNTLKSYWNQRVKWQYGTLQSLFRHIYMLFNPRYGVVGLFNYPFYLFGEAFGGIIECMAYISIFFSWYLGIFDLYMVIILFVACLGFIALLTMATVLMDIITYDKYGRLRDIPWLIVLVVTETIGFRQFSVLCRTYATLKFFFTAGWRQKQS